MCANSFSVTNIYHWGSWWCNLIFVGWDTSTHSPQNLQNDRTFSLRSHRSRHWGAGNYHSLGRTGLWHRVWNLHDHSNPLVFKLPGECNTKDFSVWLCIREILSPLDALSSEIFRDSCYRPCNPAGTVTFEGAQVIYNNRREILEFVNTFRNSVGQQFAYAAWLIFKVDGWGTVHHSPHCPQNPVIYKSQTNSTECVSSNVKWMPPFRTTWTGRKTTLLFTLTKNLASLLFVFTATKSLRLVTLSSVFSTVVGKLPPQNPVSMQFCKRTVMKVIVSFRRSLSGSWHLIPNKVSPQFHSSLQCVWVDYHLRGTFVPPFFIPRSGCPTSWISVTRNRHCPQNLLI